MQVTINHVEDVNTRSTRRLLQASAVDVYYIVSTTTPQVASAVVDETNRALNATGSGALLNNLQSAGLVVSQVVIISRPNVTVVPMPPTPAPTPAPSNTPSATPFNLSDDGEFERKNQQKLQWSGHGRWRGTWGPWRWIFQDTALWRDEGLPGPISRPAEATSLQTGRNIAQFAVETSGVDRIFSARVSHVLRVERYRDLEGEMGVGTQDQSDQAHIFGMTLGGFRNAFPFLIFCLFVIDTSCIVATGFYRF